MRATSSFFNYYRSKFQTENVNLILIFLLLIFLIPYFLLSIYNNPSTDDFDFALKTINLGFWNAQVSAYNEWNGRYFASFILCAHPLAFHSFLLYKTISIILLIFTIHSIYYFISASFNIENKKSRIVLSLLIAFSFLNDMPSLVQGIYWEPSAITYHLANIMFLYFLANLFRPALENSKQNKIRKISMGFLVLAIVGCNETSMIVINLLLLTSLGYFLFFEKRIDKFVLFYLFLSLCGTIVLLLSPGSAIRENNVMQANKHNIYFTIMSSFEALAQFGAKWLSSPQTIFCSIIFITICLKTNRKIKTTKALLFLILTFIIGYLLVSATFASGFWSISEVAPDRAVNVVYWTFTVVWYSALYFLSLTIANWKSALITKKNTILIFLLSIGFFASINSSGNYFTAWKDLIGGKAYTYDKEYRERVTKIKMTNDNVICEVPPFSVFPKSLFVEDINKDPTIWANWQVANYFLKKEVKLSATKEQSSACSYLLNYDTEEYKTYKKASAISSDIYFSPPYSSLQNGKESYSVIFEKQMKDLNVENSAEISSVEISAMVYVVDTTSKGMLVFCVTEQGTEKVLVWLAKEIDRSKQNTNNWRKEIFSVPMFKRSFLEPNNKMLIYMLNLGEGKIYMDDMTVNIY